ncbi:GNAT family N-acetyltransferase [Roseibium aggregatum]|uniref:GNAT family N-acetyltransferase n=1 Tax=Roseibium aggregatum TaxID=187304 RepID=A0A939J435_9HYPH|nr:GNAT family N-acetyltransferase [Roseibium aggregatum]MBN9671217.1 GNAT family N-acetyltransferase [Roseibium aggregatum]
MDGIVIKKVEPEDAERLHEALTRLSEDLGDSHEASVDDLLAHGFSEPPAFFALIALRGQETAGALLASPVFSTTRGGAGLYVSDLWVSAEARGAGLGQRLLAAALDHAPESWNVTFLKLAVYDDNPDARRFYDRLGFEAREGEAVMDLMEPGLSALRKSS